MTFADLIGLLGILVGLGVPIWFAFKGWSVLLLAPLAAVAEALFAREPVLSHWTQTFVQSAAGFFAQFFRLFVLGALFGKLTEDSGSVTAISAHPRPARDDGRRRQRVRSIYQPERPKWTKSVVAAAPAFATVRNAVLGIGGGPLLSLAVAINVLAALTGSVSGGLTIALDTLGATHLERVAAIGLGNPRQPTARRRRRDSSVRLQFDTQARL